ncbi:unnamed protein product [Prunus armeniaca]|uniref:Retrotransposon Copia-like N-terminal domain-containing protein n=1 Tax=Prunus armeniaca TaxID=36596 RepID=A0A6J5WTH2_PRUAR|nr:unnamed protein product [Prunus armeniaca]
MPYALFAMCFVSVAIIGDDSKVVVHSSAFRMKEDRPSRDYSAPITPDKLDSSNYASWSRGARLMINRRRMASFINGKKLAPSKLSDAYAEWEEDNCLVQSWLPKSMTKPVRALFEHGAIALDIWKFSMKKSTPSGKRLIVCVRMTLVVLLMWLVVKKKLKPIEFMIFLKDLIRRLMESVAKSLLSIPSRFLWKPMPLS